MTFVTHTEDLRRKWQDNIKTDVIETVCVDITVIVSCKHVNEPCCSIKDRNFLTSRATNSLYKELPWSVETETFLLGSLSIYIIIKCWQLGWLTG
jgi:hypothetical protein